MNPVIQDPIHPLFFLHALPAKPSTNKKGLPKNTLANVNLGKPLMYKYRLDLSLTLRGEILKISCLAIVLSGLQLLTKFLDIILQGKKQALRVIRSQDHTALNFCLRRAGNDTDEIKDEL